jgi:hypothetical protein
MITNSMTTGAPKHEFYHKLFTQVWNTREKLYDEIVESGSLEKSCKIFQRYPGVGGFIAYELALDMQMMGILADPEDETTWCSIGPGAIRGLNFIFDRERGKKINQKQALEECQWLYKEHPRFIKPHVDDSRINMRFIENGLCETSKYVSVLTTGKAKRRYNKKEKPMRESLYPGISWDRNSSRWRVRIVFEGARRGLGYYLDYNKAVRVKKRAERAIQKGTF